MTNQEMFDKVCAHLLTQNKKSINGTGPCLYRGPDSTKCAIGCLISDTMYTKSIEYKEVRVLAENPTFNTEVTSYLSQFNKDLLARLQLIHDSYFPEDWYLQLQNAAALFKLTFNPPITQAEAN